MTAGVYRDRIAYNYRKVPWHIIGEPIEDDVTVEEGVVKSKTNYPVVLGQPYGFMTLDDDRTVVTPEMLSKDSTSNAIAVLRGPSYDDTEWTVLGHASNRFSILQNIELAKIVEPFRQWGRLETIGALDDGARFFITFIGTAWDAMINGKKDPQQLYLIIKNAHLPGSSLQFQLANERVVCRNTWEKADREAVMNLPIAHTGDIHLVTEWVVNAMNNIPKQLAGMKSDVERMALIKVNDAIVKQAAEYIFPITKERRMTEALRENRRDGTALNVPDSLMIAAQNIDELVERKDRELSVQNERMLAMQRAMFTTYQESDTVDRGTAYGLFNAATETVDFVVRTAGRTSQTKKAAGSNFWGERANWKIKAYEFALEAGNF